MYPDYKTPEEPKPVEPVSDNILRPTDTYSQPEPPTPNPSPLSKDTSSFDTKPQFEQPKLAKKSKIKTILMILAIVLLTASGAALYWWRDKTANDSANKQTANIATLNAEVASLRSKLGATDSSSATTDSTADWLTYTGTLFGGYSIKYPNKGWTVEEIPANSQLNLNYTARTDSSVGDYWVNVSTYNGDTAAFTTQYGPNITIATIAGLSAKKGGLAKTSQSPENTDYLVAYKGKNYVFDFLTIGDSDGVGIKILNTLKFNS